MGVFALCPAFQSLPTWMQHTTCGPNVDLFARIPCKIGGPDWGTLSIQTKFALPPDVQPFVGKLCDGSRLTGSPAKDWLQCPAPGKPLKNLPQQICEC